PCQIQHEDQSHHCEENSIFCATFERTNECDGSPENRYRCPEMKQSGYSEQQPNAWCGQQAQQCQSKACECQKNQTERKRQGSGFRLRHLRWSKPVQCPIAPARGR